MKKYLSIFISLLILTTIGCKDEETAPIKTRTDLLTVSPWKLKAVIVEPGIDFLGTIITDFYAQVYEDCDKDNTEKYNTNGTIVYDEGKEKCDPTRPQTETSSWRFDANETKIILDSSEETTFTIESLSDTEFKYSQTFDGDEVGGNPLVRYKFVWTFSH